MLREILREGLCDDEKLGVDLFGRFRSEDERWAVVGKGLEGREPAGEETRGGGLGGECTCTG